MEQLPWWAELTTQGSSKWAPGSPGNVFRPVEETVFRKMMIESLYMSRYMGGHFEQPTDRRRT